MHTKAYYRLNELQHHYGITADEIRYLVEQKKLLLSFLLSSTKLMFGIRSKTGFTAFGFGSYRGLVTVSSEVSLQLFQKTKAKVNLVSIRKGEFAGYSTDYPYSLSTPNSVIQSWEPTKLSDAKPSTLLAKKRPYQGASGTAVLSEVVEAFKNFNAANNDVENPWAEQLKETGDKALYCDGFAFSLADACLYSKDLESLGLIGHDSASKPQNTRLNHTKEAKADKPNRVTSKPNRIVQGNIPQFQYPNSRSARLASRLIGYSPDSKSDALWSLIRKAMHDDGLLDLIDPEREVLDITPETLFWNVPEDTPERDKKLARDSFKNTVSKVKKKLS